MDLPIRTYAAAPSLADASAASPMKTPFGTNFSPLISLLQKLLLQTFSSVIVIHLLLRHHPNPFTKSGTTGIRAFSVYQHLSGSFGGLKFFWHFLNYISCLLGSRKIRRDE